MSSKRSNFWTCPYSSSVGSSFFFHFRLFTLQNPQNLYPYPHHILLGSYAKQGGFTIRRSKSSTAGTSPSNRWKRWTTPKTATKVLDRVKEALAHRRPFNCEPCCILFHVRRHPSLRWPSWWPRTRRHIHCQ